MSKFVCKRLQIFHGGVGVGKRVGVDGPSRLRIQGTFGDRPTTLPMDLSKYWSAKVSITTNFRFGFKKVFLKKPLLAHVIKIKKVTISVSRSIVNCINVSSISNAQCYYKLFICARIFCRSAKSLLWRRVLAEGIGKMCKKKNLEKEKKSVKEYFNMHLSS